MFFTNKDSHNEFHHPNQKQGVKAYKIQAKNAVALSFFTTLLISGAASAGTMGDYENNNSTANQTGVFYGANARLDATGTVSNTDTRDVYSIKDEGTLNKIDWSFYSYDGGSDAAALMYVFKDVNRNKKYDPSSDTLLFHLSNKEMSRSFYSFKGAMYLVMVLNAKNGAGKHGYYMNAGSPKTVKLNVISAKNYGKFDNGSKPDFYVKTQIYRYRRHQSKTIGNNNTPVFNHVHEETSYPERGFIPFSIDLYDSDRSSKDDQADIHPNSKFKRLDLVYDYFRNQIKTDDGRLLGKPGQTITVKGNPGGKQASVTFVVR